MVASTAASTPLLLILSLYNALYTSAFCPITYQECTNGMFNPTKCECDCIPPYCPDSSGDCLNPTGFCGGNPWSSCERGVDCPWWPNPLKAESCTTGPTVPAGIWKIHINLDHCCKVNFPYSSVCNLVMSSAPTKQPVAVATTTTTTTTTTTVAEKELIPLKFSLMGVPVNIDDVRDFKELKLKELKSIVTDIAHVLDMKVTDLQEVYDLTLSAGRGLEVNHGDRRELQSEAQNFASSPTQTVHLYYDVEVIKNPDKRYGPLLVDAVRQKHYEMLSDLQEYTDSRGYYYLSNFDLCTTSSAGSGNNNAEFDLCALDHQIVKVKFSANNIDPNLNQDELDDELLSIYKAVLNGIEGLELADIELERASRTSSGIDVYFNVDVINNDGDDWKDIIETELEKETAKKVILDEVSKYTVDKLGEDAAESANWCFDNQGIFTMSCTVAVNSSLALPMWAIIAIASTAAALVLCVIISCCICARQNAKDRDNTKHNFQAYVKDEDEWRHEQFEEQIKRSHPPPRRKNHRRENEIQIYERQPRRRPRKERGIQNGRGHRGERRERRSSGQRRRTSHLRDSIRNSFRRKSHRHRSRSPRRKRQSNRYEHKDTRETQSDEENLQFLALPPPRYDEYDSSPSPLALPPPQYEDPYAEELLALPPPLPYDHFNSDNALYCDDEEVNRPDPPMAPGPMMMLTDGTEEANGANNQEILAIEPEGAAWKLEYSSEEDSFSFGKRRQRT